MQRIALAGLLLVCACRLTAADPETCQVATEQYQSILDEVSDAIRVYAMCVYDAQGGDTCTSEFEELEAAHAHFASAVALYESECP
jgi:hypothetical protein